MSEKNFKPFCLACKGDLNPNNVQQGGMHIACAEKEVIVYSLGPIDCNKYTELQQDLIDSLDGMEFGEKWEIEKKKMTRIEFESLPEFIGF